ncbi:DUF5018 domain-containing protein [Flagellimonas sp. HMM57]|uniref:DUF5018 domain-containing protein n=1 Tax=unclassified Flagellimonas TaxID=2644544 RepID=UPI0013D31D71|nr:MULTISPECIES: DUF5018 domain-containing protein [unclassified Flagellimonas]UII77377.1 DUF5018 domain-containing protein [Flagellimonas sp. HMM57]
MKKISILFLSLFVLASCSKDDDNNGDNNAGGDKKSDAKAITAFTFLADDNVALADDVKATIDEDEKRITAEIPLGTDVTSLKPSITLSENATVDPKEKMTIDFNNDVTYTVTAEDGSTKKYTVTVTVEKSDSKQITSFVFLAVDNEALSEDVEAEINEDNKTIRAELPFGTDVTALKSSIELSVGAVIDPNGKAGADFSDDVEYTVTAEDGSEVKYSVSILITELTERQVLTELFNANPNNTLDWNLEDDDISNWSGVTLRDGKVVELFLRKTALNNIPSSIGSLGNLEKLFLDQNSLTSIPITIGNLSNLKILDLFSNSLTQIPAEITNLENLNELFLANNVLTSLPISLDGFTNLTKLRLENNRLTSIPESIGSLTKLERLSLSNNVLTAVPTSIGNLTNLEFLNLSVNSLTSVPAEIGNLKELRFLYLQNNQLTIVPKVICDLDFTIFQKDLSVPCGQ